MSYYKKKLHEPVHGKKNTLLEPRAANGRGLPLVVAAQPARPVCFASTVADGRRPRCVAGGARQGVACTTDRVLPDRRLMHVLLPLASMGIHRHQPRPWAPGPHLLRRPPRLCTAMRCRQAPVGAFMARAQSPPASRGVVTGVAAESIEGLPHDMPACSRRVSTTTGQTASPSPHL